MICSQSELGLTSIKDGINKAAKVIESGEAAAKVAAFIEMTRRLEA